MGVTVRRIGDDLTNVVTKLTKEDFQAIGFMIRDAIIDRTERGVDAQNRPFTPYSQSYAKQRSKEGLESSVVNLQVSGRMLEAIKVLATHKSVTVYY